MRSEATSEPAPDSVTAIEHTAVPAMAGTRYERLSSSVPNSCNEGVAMHVCTPIAIGMPAAPEPRASSSHRITV